MTPEFELQRAMEMNFMHAIREAKAEIVIDCLHIAFEAIYERFEPLSSKLIDAIEQMPMDEETRKRYETSKTDMEDMREMKTAIDELYAEWRKGQNG